MSERLRILVGVLSTVMFLGLGGLMLSEERTGLGAVFLAIGLLRGSLLARQLFGNDETPR